MEPIMTDLTIYTAERPSRLSKRYTLSPDGLIKEGGGRLSRGRVEIASIDDLGGLAEIIAGLTPAQALGYGLPRDPRAKRVAARAARRGPGTITRTEDDIAWSAGSAVIMFDYDPEEDASVLSRDDLVARLIEACPELAGVQMLWVPSSSSHVSRIGGEDLTGLRGQRLYLIVESGADIPRAGRALVDRLWLAGHGRVMLSKAGSMLERTLVDASVWQASRLDFAAGAEMGRGLEQRRGDPVIVHPEGAVAIDSTRAIPDLSSEERTRLAALIADARHGVSRQAEEMRSSWLAGRRGSEIRAISGRTDLCEDISQLERMLDERELLPDIVLFVETEPGSDRFDPVRVRDVCADPEKYHGMRALDPFEPEYDGRRPVAKIYGRKDGVVCHSFAHGSRTWTLTGSVEQVPVKPAPMSQTTNALLEAMRAKGPYFDFGDGLALVSDGRIRILDDAALDLSLAQRIHIVDEDKDGNSVPVDPSARLLRQVTSAKSGRRLRPLKGLSDRPIVRPDGTIVARAGYDEATGIYVSPADPEMCEIPASPTREDVDAALDAIWRPFAEFPYADAASRGSVLAAAITSVLVESFPTTPAFMTEGPVRGAGKTLLMQAIMALGTGRAVGVTPMPRVGDEDEMGKVITSAVHPDHAARGLLFDNCEGLVASKSLAALITGETYTGRILGSSRLLLDVPARIFVGVTGSNLELDVDLGRRFLCCRLDPDCEVAFTRAFDFDPVDRVLEERPRIVAAILTLVRASQLAERPQAAPFGSFAAWDGIVRRALLFAGRHHPGKFWDPVAATIERVQTSGAACEHHALVTALAAAFGPEPFNAGHVAQRLRDLKDDPNEAGEQLADALRDLGRRPEDLSTRSIGRYLLANRDRWSGGMILRAQQNRRSCTWRIEYAQRMRAANDIRAIS
jgi:hypothetical protein